MRITIIHQHVPVDAAVDERDVLDQVAAINKALTSYGHCVSVLPCTTDLGNMRRKLEIQKPECIFNLVETLDGSGRLIHLAPALWEVAGLLFTGSSADALYLTTHKLLSKERMHAAGMPVPAWIQTQASAKVHGDDDGMPADWIIKSVWEHASIGLDDNSVLRDASAVTVAERVPPGSFAERFIDGREFNLALLTGKDGPECLPVAEIVFNAFPPDKPRIVGYQAKWDQASFEYAHTVRRFVDPLIDGALVTEMQRLAVRCWEVFDLGGYARVDFRVDANGKPWILEVNANPCLAPDSGFAAALEQAGISYAEAIQRIVHDAVKTYNPIEQATKASHSNTHGSTITFRHEVKPTDVVAVRELTKSTGYFHDDEIIVAVELVEERLAKGVASGYEFVFAESDGQVVGYSAFGPIPCTRSSFDWYWLAVHPTRQGHGTGRQLLAQTEYRVRAMGGTRLYAETSGRPQYASTRAFYERMGFTLCELLYDYYDVGDARAIYFRPLEIERAM